VFANEPMLGITAAILIALTAVTWYAVRSALFPPVLFNGIWALTVLCLYLAGPRFFPVSENACLIYLTGAAAFSVASLMTVTAFRYLPSSLPAIRRSAQSARTVLDVLLILLIAAFPYYLKVALQIAGTANIIQALPEIRLRTVEAPNANLFGMAGNLNVLAIIVAEACVFESDGSWRRRLRSILAIVVALAYGVLTGSKLGALFLLTAFFVSQVRARRLKLTHALAVAALAMVFFGTGVILVNLTGRNFESTGEVASTVGKIVVGSYLLGPSVAFSRVAERPDSLVSSAGIDRVFLATASKLGFAVQLPSINNATYTQISGDGESTNVYTIYFSYFKDYGWGGMILLLSGLAMLLTLLWQRAMSGEPVAVLIYASMCTSILLSSYTEEFFTGLEGFLKAYAVFWFLYRFLPRFGSPLWVMARAGASQSNV
jgi:oligosaccharide repeat unit polymerase